MKVKIMGEDREYTFTLSGVDVDKVKQQFLGDETSSDTDSITNHPRHYNRDGAIECIDEMILVFGKEATAHFCLLNCWKYRYRAGLKNNGYQDIEKSDWYMRKYKELKEELEEEKKDSGITIPYSPPWTVTPYVTYTNTVASTANKE